MEYHRLFACKLTLGHCGAIEEARIKVGATKKREQVGSTPSHTFLLSLKESMLEPSVLFRLLCWCQNQRNLCQSLACFEAKGHFYHLCMTTFHGIIKP